jgi:hypothetical protein
MDANVANMIEGEFARIKAGIPTPKTEAEWSAFIADERARTRAFNAALVKSAAEQRAARQATYAAAESQLATVSAGHKFEGSGTRCTRCRVRKAMHS